MEHGRWNERSDGWRHRILVQHFTYDTHLKGAKQGLTPGLTPTGKIATVDANSLQKCSRGQQSP